MRFLGRLLLGTGTLPPALRSELEREGLVVAEEGLSASVGYKHFKAPGRRFNGKVTPVRAGLGLSEERLAVYSNSGKAELIDSPFSSPRWKAVDIEVDGGDKFVMRIDYSRMADASEAGVSGEITIRVKTGEAAHVAEAVQSRLAGTRG